MAARFYYRDLYPRRCFKCGVPKAWVDFRLNTGRRFSCCLDCHAAMTTAYRARPSVIEHERVRDERYRKRRNEESRAVASRNGYEWTSADLEAVANYDYSATELAAILGRTNAAVRLQRAKIKSGDPKTIALLGARISP